MIGLATENQKSAILKGLSTQNMDTSDVNMETLSKADASAIIQALGSWDRTAILKAIQEAKGAHEDAPAQPSEPKELPTKKVSSPPANPDTAELIELVDGKWNNSQIQLIHDTYARGTTKEEFRLFLYQAWRMGLDPLLKEIWCLKYGTEPATIFASFSGIQKKAMQSGEWDGYEIVMESSESQIKQGEAPKSITCTMYRKGVTHPVVFTAHYEEFARYKKDGSLQPSWAKMPIIMLRKCAIANAIRQAYPDCVGSIYIPEEMPQ